MATTFSNASTVVAPGNYLGDFILSNGNLTVALTTGPGIAPAITTTTGMVNNRIYFEMFINDGGANPSVGIILVGDSIQNFPGATAGGYSYYSVAGQKANNNVLTAYGSSYGTNDTVGCAFDGINGNIWFSKNGVWQNSATIAEIVAGTTTHAAFTGIGAGTYYVATGMGSSNNTLKATGSFSGTFTYPVPGGYNAIDVQQASPVQSWYPPILAQ